MNNTVRKILQIGFLILTVVGSVVIFIYRESLQSINEISYLGVFLLCLIANSTVLLPAPSLMITASFAVILNPIAVAVCAALGSAFGEFVGYGFGAVSISVSPVFQRLIDFLSEKIRRKTVLVFLLALLPLPLFDAAGILSGGTQMRIIPFFAAFTSMLISYS